MRLMMKNKRSLGSKVAIVALPLCAAIMGYGSIALAQDPPPPPPPPDTYIATAEPVYYNGQPAYWYQNHWYYRDAGAQWHYYREEPRELHDHRMHGPPPRHFDEHHGRR